MSSRGGAGLRFSGSGGLGRARAGSGFGFSGSGRVGPRPVCEV